MYSGFFTGRALGKVTSCEIVLPVWLNQLQEGFVVKYKKDQKVFTCVWKPVAFLIKMLIKPIWH